MHLSRRKREARPPQPHRAPPRVTIELLYSCWSSHDHMTSSYGARFSHRVASCLNPHRLTALTVAHRHLYGSSAGNGQAGCGLWRTVARRGEETSGEQRRPTALYLRPQYVWCCRGVRLGDIVILCDSRYRYGRSSQSVVRLASRRLFKS